MLNQFTYYQQNLLLLYNLSSKIKFKVKNFYEKYSKEFDATRQKPWQEVIYYSRIFKENWIIADIGCGNCRHSIHLLSRNCLVIGLDISYNLIRLAKKKVKNNFLFYPIVCDALHIPLKNESVNGIISVALIHHIPFKINRLRFVNECIRILNKNGLIITTAWNLLKIKHIFKALLEYPFYKINQEIAEFGDVYLRWGKYAKRYFHLFTLKELVKTFNSKKLKILLFSSFGKGMIKDNHIIIAKKNN